MKKFNVWLEGYHYIDYVETERGIYCDERVCKAKFLGRYKACDFAEACKKSVENHPNFRKYYNPILNTFFGCKFFETEKEARKSFG